MSAQPPAPLKPSPLSTDESPFQYRGHEILDLLREARNYNRWLTDQIIAAKPPDAVNITDLGAGRGTFAEMLRARGIVVDCVEPDPKNQAILRRGGFLVRATTDEHDPESIDYVYTLNVLEHVSDDEALVRTVFSRLRRGGSLFVFVPAFPILFSRFDDYVEHRRRYRRRPMEAMLRRAGFILERPRYADCLGFFAALVFAHNPKIKISPSSVWIYDRLLFPISRVLDPVLGWFFGKNLAVKCRKP